MHWGLKRAEFDLGQNKRCGMFCSLAVAVFCLPLVQSRLPARFRDELNNCAGTGPHHPATPSPQRPRVTFATRGAPRSLLREDIVFIPRRIGLRLAPSTPGVAQRASEFYSSVMLNKRQQILGARALNFLQSVRQLMAAPGPSWLLKYWKPSLDRWHHREFTGRVTCSAPCR